MKKQLLILGAAAGIFTAGPGVISPVVSETVKIGFMNGLQIKQRGIG